MPRTKRLHLTVECNVQAVVQQALEVVFVMKIRLRFSKQGQMKFIGHLDMVRYFQKVMRRSEAVSYTHLDVYKRQTLERYRGFLYALMPRNVQLQHFL